VQDAETLWDKQHVPDKIEECNGPLNLGPRTPWAVQPSSLRGGWNRTQQRGEGHQVSASGDDEFFSFVCAVERKARIRVRGIVAAHTEVIRKVTSSVCRRPLLVLKLNLVN
jgi:hypothetical protein